MACPLLRERIVPELTQESSYFNLEILFFPLTGSQLNQVAFIIQPT
jgi:hypothetical protein